MNRPLIIGLIGGVVVVVAIALTFLFDRAPATSPPVADQTAAPPPPATAGAAQPEPAPQVPAPAAIGQPARPSFDVVRVNPQGDAVMAGRAEPDSEVTLRDGGTEIGKVKADSRGQWVLVPKKPLPAGSREFSLSAKKGPGPARESDKKVVIVVPERGKDIAGRSVSGPAGSLALLVPRDGTGATTVLQKTSADKSPTDTSRKAATAAGTGPAVASEKPPAADPAAAPRPAAPAAAPPAVPGKPKIKLALDAIDYGDAGKLSLSGTAPPRTGVRVYLDNRPLGTAETGGSGRWRIEPEKEVTTGLYTIRVDQVEKGGRVVARIETKFSRAGPLGDLPPGVVVFVQPGTSLWRIARRSYGSGIRYSVIYEANKEQIRDPLLIYPGQVFLIPRVN